MARLVAQIQKIDKEGGDLGAFLEAMTKSTHAWADRHERLMEVWLDQAVNGNAAERRRAVRLLAALGEKAVQRLAEELRHSRRHGGKGQTYEDDATDEETTDEEPGQLDAPGLEVAAGSPQVYDLKDLFARGMNAVQLRSLCLKTANAVAVKQFRTQFVVTAAENGHTLLQEKLHDVRVAGILADKSKAEKGAAGKAKDDAKVRAVPTAPVGRPAPPAGRCRVADALAPAEDEGPDVGSPDRSPEGRCNADSRRSRRHRGGPAQAARREEGRQRTSLAARAAALPRAGSGARRPEATQEPVLLVTAAARRVPPQRCHLRRAGRERACARVVGSPAARARCHAPACRCAAK